MVTATLGFAIFVIFGTGAVVYGIYAVSANVKSVKRANLRIREDNPQNMFRFEKPMISDLFEKELKNLRDQNVSITGNKLKEMVAKLVNRALENLAPMRHAQSVFQSSRTMYTLHKIDEETWKEINRMKQDCDIEYRQVLQRANELGFKQGNIFQMAARIEAHKIQQQRIAFQKKLEAAKKEFARRQQQKQYEDYLKQLEKEKEEEKDKNENASNDESSAGFGGLKKGFLRQRNNGKNKKSPKKGKKKKKKK